MRLWCFFYLLLFRFAWRLIEHFLSRATFYKQ
ncbi:Uncharacterised protein [Vibrio cholerae]|nr:Uncharacterised protein [Vibrio cholerae]